MDKKALTKINYSINNKLYRQNTVLISLKFYLERVKQQMPFLASNQ